MGSVGNGSNSKYNGFSITDAEGNTTNYRVVNGEVQYANGAPNRFMGVDFLSTIQSAYNQLGDVQAVIDRVNSVGQATAQKLSDAEVERMIQERDKDREEQRKDAERRDAKRSRKGVNRHRAYWSAM